jgi:hypothetical protein
MLHYVAAGETPHAARARGGGRWCLGRRLRVGVRCGCGSLGGRRADTRPASWRPSRAVAGPPSFVGITGLCGFLLSPSESLTGSIAVIDERGTVKGQLTGRGNLCAKRLVQQHLSGGLAQLTSLINKSVNSQGMPASTHRKRVSD